VSAGVEPPAPHPPGLEVLGISLVTNLAAGIGAAPLDHAEVLAAGAAAADRVTALLARVIPQV
jgi:purine-nucleoside phosphorylase